MTEGTPVRIDGWKAIAWHFGRDRSTVMRWARDRNLPVRRVPGSGSTSVHAFVHELDEWLVLTRPDQTDEVAAPAEETSVSRRPRWLAPALVAVAALGVAAIAVPAAWRDRGSAAPGVRALPADSRIASIYLEAREDWATRTPEGLQRAIVGFGAVVTQEPRFAAAYAGLAETYLLAREYDTVPDAEAYAKAEAMARAAIALDPDSVEAQRALGFVSFWWRRDIGAARAAMDRALRLDPRDAQTHFWYGNMLIDNGEFAEGLRALNTARLIEPGSKPILADYAWALWASGRRAEGRARLVALAAGTDGQQSPHAYLALMHLVEGDYERYLAATAAHARPRGGTERDRTAAQQAAFDRGGAPALLAKLLDEATRPERTAAARDASWPALLAALAGNRDLLLTILRAAETRGERWGSVALLDRAFTDWRDDPEVMRLVSRRQSEPLRQGRAQPG